MDTDFSTWLTSKLNERGWTYSELARRSGLTGAAVSAVVTGKRNPGSKLCLGIARALGESPNTVFRLAGLMPLTPPVQINEIDNIMQSLPQIEQQEILDYARYRYERFKRKK